MDVLINSRGDQRAIPSVLKVDFRVSSPGTNIRPLEAVSPDVVPHGSVSVSYTKSITRRRNRTEKVKEQWLVAEFFTVCRRRKTRG